MLVHQKAGRNALTKYWEQSRLLGRPQLEASTLFSATSGSGRYRKHHNCCNVGQRQSFDASFFFSAPGSSWGEKGGVETPAKSSATSSTTASWNSICSCTTCPIALTCIVSWIFASVVRLQVQHNLAFGKIWQLATDTAVKLSAHTGNLGPLLCTQYHGSGVEVHWLTSC